MRRHSISTGSLVWVVAFLFYLPSTNAFGSHSKAFARQLPPHSQQEVRRCVLLWQAAAIGSCRFIRRFNRPRRSFHRAPLLLLLLLLSVSPVGIPFLTATELGGMDASDPLLSLHHVRFTACSAGSYATAVHAATMSVFL